MSQKWQRLAARRAKTKGDNTAIIPALYYRITTSAYAIRYL
jgi:hypothetical protein